MKVHYRLKPFGMPCSLFQFPRPPPPSLFHAPLPMVPLGVGPFSVYWMFMSHGPLFLDVHVSGSSIFGSSCLKSSHALRFSSANRGENASVCVCEQICQGWLHLCSFHRGMGLPHMGWGINLGEQDRHSRLFLCSYKRSAAVGIDVPLLLHYRSQLLCSFCRGDERRRGQRTTRQTGTVQG
jgi:hypothetical protein